jgi:hypothetical protein
MRIATFVLCVIDAALWVFLAYLLFGSGEEAEALGLNVYGWMVTGLFIVTVPPALALAIKSRWRRTAFVLTLIFPSAFLALLVYAAIILW